MRKVDVSAGAILIACGVFVLTQSLPLNFYSEGVPGPGFFPTLLAIAMAVTGGLLLFTRLRRPEAAQAGRSLGLWIAILVAVLAVDVVGFLAAMVLLVAVLMLGIERARSVPAIATIVLTPLLAYLLFAQLLQVPLPAGLFGD